MNSPLLVTKFHIPIWHSSGVSRARLLDQLTLGLSEKRKLTLVSAPAGYGKTTLIANWIHSLSDRYRITWVSLEESDSDPIRFMNYWLTAFQGIDKEILQSAQSKLNLPQVPPLEMILDELLNELATIEYNVIIVLDDYHTINNQKVHSALEYFIDHLPSQIHLVITTREDPPIKLSRIRSNGLMMEIREHDLRFTLDEAHQFFIQTMHLELPEDTIRSLDVRTEGWIAGLQLAALAIQNLPKQNEFIQTFSGTHRYILDYLAEEVLSQLDEEINNFLFQIAPLERFNAKLCDAISSETNSQEILEHLERSNLFVIPLDNERIWYRFHHLFSDYLQSHLNKTQKKLIWKNASQWYEQNGLVFEAVKYAFLADDLEMTADLIERVIQDSTAWSSGEISTLVGWLDALPSQLLQSRPALCLHASRAWYIAGKIGLAEKYLNLADQSLAEKKVLDSNDEILLAISLERRAALAVMNGNLNIGIENLNYSLKNLPEEEAYNRARVKAIIGLAYGLRGDLDKGYSLLIEASDYAYTAGVSFMTMVTRCEASLLQITLGKLDLANQTIQETLQLVGKKPIPPLGFAYYVLAEIAWERNELSSAENYLVDGMKISKEGVLIDDFRIELMLLAQLRKAAGDFAGALSTMEQAHAICQSFEIPRLITLSEAHRARIQLANGMLDKVEHWAKKYQELYDSHQVEYTREYEDLTLARVYLSLGKYEQALHIVTTVFEQAKTAERNKTCIEAAILLSLTTQAQNKSDIASQWLGTAISLAAPENFLRLFLDEGPRVANSLPIVRNIAPKFVDQLLQEFSTQTQNSDQKTSKPSSNKLISTLTEQETKVLNLIMTGKSNKEIAEELFVSIGTAKWHVHNIYQKLGVGNRAQAIALARDLGF